MTKRLLTWALAGLALTLALSIAPPAAKATEPLPGFGICRTVESQTACFTFNSDCPPEDGSALCHDDPTLACDLLPAELQAACTDTVPSDPCAALPSEAQAACYDPEPDVPPCDALSGDDLADVIECIVDKCVPTAGGDINECVPTECMSVDLGGPVPVQQQICTTGCRLANGAEAIHLEDLRRCIPRTCLGEPNVPIGVDIIHGPNAAPPVWGDTGVAIDPSPCCGSFKGLEQIVSTGQRVDCRDPCRPVNDLGVPATEGVALPDPGTLPLPEILRPVDGGTGPTTDVTCPIGPEDPGSCGSNGVTTDVAYVTFDARAVETHGNTVPPTYEALAARECVSAGVVGGPGVAQYDAFNAYVERGVPCGAQFANSFLALTDWNAIAWSEYESCATGPVILP